MWHFPSPLCCDVWSFGWAERETEAGPQMGVMLSLKRLMVYRDKELILATGKPIKSGLETVMMRSWLQSHWKENDLGDKKKKKNWSWEAVKKLSTGQMTERRTVWAAHESLDPKPTPQIMCGFMHSTQWKTKDPIGHQCRQLIIIITVYCYVTWSSCSLHPSVKTNELFGGLLQTITSIFMASLVPLSPAEGERWRRQEF